MNTKSVVAKPKVAKAAKAVVKKPKAMPKVAKAVVKKPRAVPRAAKAVVKKPKVAKAVVKKPKATPKVAKAVVKKPKAVPKAAKAAKAAKAVVKKPIRGGVRSRTSNNLRTSFSGVLSATASRIRSTFSRGQRRTPSNAVAPSNAVVAPIAIEKEVRLTKLKRMLRPPPNFLLDKIKDTYISYMNKLIDVGFITVYDLLVLIETIATDLNAFFEDFLYYYPTIIFKDNKYASNIYSRGLLTYQSKFVRLIENIRHYIHDLKSGGGHDIGIPYYRSRYEGYLDASTIVYNGILDGTQEGIEGYKKSPLNFFTNELILSIDGRYSSYISEYKRKNLYFGRLLVFVGENPIEFNTIIMELNVILQQFFSHIQSIGINEGISALDEEKIEQSRKYIKLVKDTATENLRIISSYPYKFNLLIEEKEREGRKDIKRRSENARFFAQNQHSPI